jgi:Mycothiol maleylpyruvate isomerase N-terminal domain
MSATDPRRVARIYHDTKDRVTSLVTSLDEAALRTAVPACPSWSIRDVVAHLAATSDDIGRGV